MGIRLAKVFYLHPAKIPSESANSVQVVKVCSALSGLGNEVTLVCLKGDRSLSLVPELYGVTDSFRCIGLNQHIRFARELVFGMRALVSAYTAGSGALIYTRSPSMAWMAVRLGFKCVLELHLPPKAFRTKVRNRLECVSRSPNLLVTTINQALKTEFEREFSPRNEILVAHDGADELPQGVEARLGLAGDFRVGYVGHLYPGKGMELISEMIKLCPWATFHVIGGPQDMVQLWNERLENYDNVIFHGEVAHEETPSYSIGMDVLLAPYLPEVRGIGSRDIAPWMSPLKIFEYMSVGGCILASDLPAIREVLEDRRNAILCDAKDPASWVEALLEIQRDADLLPRLKEASKSDFLSYYTWDTRVRKIMNKANLL